MEMHRRPSALLAVLAFVACGPMLVAACGGDPVSTERPLTADEAGRLAEVLFDNLDDGGASFEVATSFRTTGDDLSLRGEVDWVTHTGRAVVSASGAEAAIVEVFWSDDVVIERIPGITTLSTGLGFPNAEWVARQPDPTLRQLDRALALVTGLASSTRSNPVLLQQEEGSAFLRNDELRGVEVEVLRFGTRNRYWLDRATGEMLRFDGDSQSGTAPTVIDIIDRGARSVPGPDPSRVVDRRQVDEIYRALVGP